MKVCELLFFRPSQVSNEGASALCVAAQEGHDDVVQLLLENGAKMNIADKFDRTPMQVAAEAGMCIKYS